MGGDFEREILRNLNPTHCDTTFTDVDTYEWVEDEIERYSKLRDELRFEKTQKGRPVDGLRATEEKLGTYHKQLEKLRLQYGLLIKPKEPSKPLVKGEIPWLNR